MRILLTGGSGYLGRCLAVPAAAAAADLIHTYFSNQPPAVPGARRLDVRDGPAVQDLARDFAPDVIIHAAGSSGRPQMAEVIELGARNIAEAAARGGARLIHLSTDVVFDGRSAPYAEDDPPRPIHEYGRAKARAERIVAQVDNHVIVRTSLIYGLQQMDHGTAWLARALQQGKPATLFVDQLRNPVWVASLSAACLELAAADYRGILHVAGGQVLSRAQFGLRMLRWWGITERQTLRLGPGDGARWPADCTLDISRARRLLATPLPGVDQVLAAHGFDAPAGPQPGP